MGKQGSLPASAKRLREARKKGDVAKSSTLSGAAGLSAFTLCAFFQHQSWVNLRSFMEKSLLLEADFHSKHMLVSGTDALGLLLSFVGPFFLTMSFLAIATEIAQVGFVFSLESLKPKFEKCNLFRGLARILGVQEEESSNTLLRDLLKHSVHLLVLGSMFLGVLAGSRRILLAQDYQSAGEVLEVSALVIGILLVSSLLVLFVLGLVDLSFQRLQRAKRLRMSVEEFRQEHRESQGDPETRGMRKQLHQEILLHGLVQQVRRAAVVVRGRGR